MMSSWESYTEERLEEWGSWARSGEVGNLYYSSISNIGKIMATGGVHIDRSYSANDENPRAQEVDRLVSLYAKEHPLEARLLHGWYVCKAQKETLARLLKISVRTFYERLSRAKSWLEGCLTIK